MEANLVKFYFLRSPVLCSPLTIIERVTLRVFSFVPESALHVSLAVLRVQDSVLIKLHLFQCSHVALRECAVCGYH